MDKNPAAPPDSPRCEWRIWRRGARWGTAGCNRAWIGDCAGLPDPHPCPLCGRPMALVPTDDSEGLASKF